MKSIVIGGGKVGYYLVKTLKERKYDVTLVEKDKDVCHTIAEDVAISVICGDGTDIDVLKDAGIEEAEVIAAVTGTDEVNLVICKIAKSSFRIAEVITRVNNPKNISMFKALGADKTVCSTEVIANLIEYEFDKGNFKIVHVLERGTMILAEIKIEKTNDWCDQLVKDLVLPDECILISILREGKVIYPRGNTRILESDEILVIANKSSLAELRK